MKLLRKQKEARERAQAKPHKRRRPRDFHFCMDSGTIIWRVHGSYGKPIEDV